MRLIGVDFGGKRIGVAVMDLESRLPRPLGTIAASGTLARDAEAICEVVVKESAEAVVLGLPLDADGDTKMSKIVRKLGERLVEAGLRTILVDESLTSSAAEDAMREQDLSGAEIRKRVDAEAACRILERFAVEHGP